VLVPCLAAWAGAEGWARPPRAEGDGEENSSSALSAPSVLSWGIGEPGGFAGGPIPRLAPGAGRWPSRRGGCPDQRLFTVPGTRRAVLCQVRPEASRGLCPCISIPVFRSCLGSVVRGGVPGAGGAGEARVPRLPPEQPPGVLLSRKLCTEAGFPWLRLLGMAGG